MNKIAPYKRKAFSNISHLFLLLNVRNKVLLEKEEMFQYLDCILIFSVEGLKIYKKCFKIIIV